MCLCLRARVRVRASVCVRARACACVRRQHSQGGSGGAAFEARPRCPAHPQAGPHTAPPSSPRLPGQGRSLARPRSQPKSVSPAGASRVSFSQRDSILITCGYLENACDFHEYSPNLHVYKHTHTCPPATRMHVRCLTRQALQGLTRPDTRSAYTFARPAPLSLPRSGRGRLGARGDLSQDRHLHRTPGSELPRAGSS